jgi:hypothetical protein
MKKYTVDKIEREWVAMLLAEMRALGHPDVSEHYYVVLVRMDHLLAKELDQCLAAFRKEAERGKNES